MPVTFDVNKALDLAKELWVKENPPNVPFMFSSSLLLVLEKIQVDERIDDIRKAAYLLGTAAGESGYSLSRWEADYVCTTTNAQGKKISMTGIAYGEEGPCQSALSYYRSTAGGKKNYYTLGLDKKGLPYFGRGLIQLTGKGNYETYGDKIGVNLVDDADLALEENNSYNIAVEYMIKRKTFTYVTDPKARFTTKKGSWTGLEAARRSVNGGIKGLSEINKSYKWWVETIKKTTISNPIKTQGTIISGTTVEPIKGATIKIVEPLPRLEPLRPTLVSPSNPDQFTTTISPLGSPEG